MSESKNIILIMGPQGSGKTTQGKLLANKLGYQFISTGELIRNSTPEEVDTEEWEHMKKGDLVTDEIVEGLLFPVFTESKVAGFVVDGYPRSESQLDNLINFLNKQGYKLTKVFNIYITEEESRKRVSERAFTEDRPDEGIEAFRHRIDLYHKKTEPLLAKYKELGILSQINGHQSIEAIANDIHQDITGNN